VPTITIRNLDETVKQRLRMLAAEHGRSMEAEARAILTRVSLAPQESANPVRSLSQSEKKPSVCDAVRGSWKGRMSTDEIMYITRGE